MNNHKTNCPICNHPMRQVRKGATLKKRGAAYVCPIAEKEVYKDENGHLKRTSTAVHTSTQVYEEQS